MVSGCGQCVCVCVARGCGRWVWLTLSRATLGEGIVLSPPGEFLPHLDFGKLIHRIHLHPPTFWKFSVCPPSHIFFIQPPYSPHRCHVCAISEGGQGMWSPLASFETPPTRPSPPAELRVTGKVTQSSGVVQWGRLEGGEGGREGGREEGREEGGREGGRQAGRQAGREGGRQAGSQGGRQAGRERVGGWVTRRVTQSSGVVQWGRGREGGREGRGGREGGREEGERYIYTTQCYYNYYLPDYYICTWEMQSTVILGIFIPKYCVKKFVKFFFPDVFLLSNFFNQQNVIPHVSD